MLEPTPDTGDCCVRANTGLRFVTVAQISSQSFIIYFGELKGLDIPLFCSSVLVSFKDGGCLTYIVLLAGSIF